MVAFRYLRARRQEGFVSVIAIFSLLGIGLGVATLIVVMSVMNGFRQEFVSNIIGVDGHLTVRAAAGAVLTGFDELDTKIRQVSGVVGVRPLVEGQVFAQTPRGSTGVSVRGLRIEDIASQALLAKGIATQTLDQFSDDNVILGWRLLQSLGARIEDWRQSNATFINAITIERNVMFLILTLIILVAAFNIVSGMVMFVQDKGGDIAILRTMGATRAMVMRIFMLSGASIGFVGTIFGFIVGVEFATHIRAIRDFLESDLGLDIFTSELDFFTRIPAQVYVSDVVSVVAMAFGLSFLATLYPSWRAARLDPVEALRYE